MIGAFVLVVFQMNAGGNLNWEKVDELKSRALCNKAAAALVSRQEEVKGATGLPKAFACLAKDVD